MSSSNSIQLNIDKFVEEKRELLDSISQQLWREPELSLKEYKSHKLLCDALEAEGFKVKRSTANLETAFIAAYVWEKQSSSSSSASSSLTSNDNKSTITLAFVSEYDALPEIGHACGHNLIAISGVAAALATRHILNDSSLAWASAFDRVVIKLFGTPAEETVGGKVTMIEAGDWQGVDVSMMVHPSTFDASHVHTLAVQDVTVTYTGQSAHAAGWPWEGRNALDGVVQSYVAISMMRQHMQPSCRVHGIITDGGAAPNIVPERASACYYVRAVDRRELDIVKAKVEACFRGAAVSTHTEVDIAWGLTRNLDVHSNSALAERYAEHWRRSYMAEGVDTLGSADEQLKKPLGSTDFGNVTYATPGIHPIYNIECANGKSNHTHEFAAAAGTRTALDATLVASKLLALVALDLVAEPDFLASVKREHEEFLATQ
jgi:Xaa-Arg dipeptidase